MNRVEECHWRWRLDFAERLAECLDAGRFGVKAAYLSVDKTQSELDSDLFRGEAVLLRSAGWFGTTASKEITLGFQGYGSHTLLLVRHISSRNRTISSGSLLPIVSMMRATDARE